MKKKTVSAFVLDCSVTMAWCFEDEKTTYTEMVLESLQFATAKVPSLWPLEVANVLLLAERKKRLTTIQSVNFKNALDTLTITIDHSTSDRAMDTIFEIAKEYGLTIYGASYLELAWREKLPLCTLDKLLRKRASAIGVELL